MDINLIDLFQKKNMTDALRQFFIKLGINILHAIIIVLILLILTKILIFISNNIIRQNKKRFSEQRIITLQNIFRNFIKYTMGIIIIISILISLGVTGQSLLAGAGFFGIIIGIGARELVTDTINGFFVVFEDTYDVGEYIMINSYEGYVQSLGVKSTVLKTFNNEIITIPNSSVKEVINFSKNDYVIYYYFKTEQDIKVNFTEGLINNELIPKLLGIDYMKDITYLGVHAIDLNSIEYMLEMSIEPEKRFAASRISNKVVKELFENHSLNIPTTNIKIDKK